MCKLKKSDFYYGAFLSALLNSGKAKPSLFDDVDSNSRRIYKFATEQTEKDHIVFTKYCVGVKNEDSWRWNFVFTKDEIQKLESLNEQYGNVKLALICVKKDLIESEIAIVSYHQMVKCMGLDIGTRSNIITVKTRTGKHGLLVFGSGIIEDNAIKISRDMIGVL